MTAYGSLRRRGGHGAHLAGAALSALGVVPPWGAEVEGTPATIVYGGNLHVFLRARDGNLYDHYWDGAACHLDKAMSGSTPPQRLQAIWHCDK